MTTIDNFQQIEKPVAQSKIKSFYRSSYTYHGKSFSTKIESVEINYHSLLRWNERIGPKVTIEELELLFTQLLQIPYRITRLTNEIGVIDDDIIFIYKIKDTSLVILTIYGRLSLKPSLQDLKELKNYNYYHYDRLNLSIQEHILNEQILPLIPKKLIYFQGTRRFYRIELFNSIEGDMIYLSLFENGQQKIRHINISQPKQSKLNKKVLFVLCRLGYENFVLEHFQHHYSAKYKEYEQEVSRKFGNNKKAVEVLSVESMATHASQIGYEHKTVLK